MYEYVLQNKDQIKRVFISSNLVHFQLFEHVRLNYNRTVVIIYTYNKLVLYLNV